MSALGHHTSLFSYVKISKKNYIFISDKYFIIRKDHFFKKRLQIIFIKWPESAETYLHFIDHCKF